MIGLGIANAIPTSSSNVEPSESTLYLRMRWDTSVT